MVSNPGAIEEFCSSENLVVLDIQRPQPALLAHGDRNEVADLDQLRLREIPVQAFPQRIVGGQSQVMHSA